MAKILTLNIGASKALLAEYTLGGKRSLTLTAYGSGELQAVDVNDPGSIAAALPSVLHQIMRETGIRPAPLKMQKNRDAGKQRHAQGYPRILPVPEQQGAADHDSRDQNQKNAVGNDFFHASAPSVQNLTTCPQVTAFGHSVRAMRFAAVV